MFPDSDDLDGVFTLESGGREVVPDEPFYVLLMGDWAGGRIGGPLEIDRDNFDEVLRRCRPALELDFGVDGGPLQIEFESIDDFHPDGLFSRLPIFRELREVRNELASAATFERAAGRIRSWQASATSGRDEATAANDEVAHGSVDAAELLGDLLESASGKIGGRSVERSELDRFISRIVEPHIVGIDDDEQRTLTAWLDRAAGDLMRRILHHPGFQETEAAWRGVYFLVRRIETDSDLRVFLLDRPKHILHEDLQEVSDLADSGFYRLAVSEGYNGRPFSVIGGNYRFGMTVEDAALLMRIASICAAAGTPFLSFVEPAMFGDGTIDEIVASGTPDLRKESREGRLWDAVRTADGAEFLGLCPQNVLGRLPYGSATDETESFVFEEFGNSHDRGEYLWINPCFALSLLVAGSYRRYGADVWGRLASEVGKLPMHTYRIDGESRTEPVAQVCLTESAAEVLVENGLITLAAFRDSDRLRVIRWQSIASPERSLGGR